MNITDTPVTTHTSGTQILIFRYRAPVKGTGALLKNGISRIGTGKIQMSLEHQVVSESKEVFNR